MEQNLILVISAYLLFSILQSYATFEFYAFAFNIWLRILSVDNSHMEESDSLESLGMNICFNKLSRHVLDYKNHHFIISFVNFFLIISHFFINILKDLFNTVLHLLDTWNDSSFLILLLQFHFKVCGH